MSVEKNKSFELILLVLNWNILQKYDFYVFFIIVYVALSELASDRTVLILTFESYFLSLSIFLRLPSKPSPIPTSSFGVNLGCTIERSRWPEQNDEYASHSFTDLRLSKSWCLLSFLNIVVAIPALLLFHLTWKTCLSWSMKKPYWNCIEFRDCLRKD